MEEKDLLQVNETDTATIAQESEPIAPEVPEVSINIATTVETPETTAPPPPPKPKKSKKPLLIILGIVCVCAIATILLVYFLVIQPNAIYDDAVTALKSGNFQECEQLINKIPNHKDVPQLRIDLDIEIAKSYIKSGDLDLAENLLVRLTNSSEATKLRKDIQYLKAEALINSGKFDEAKEILDKIPDYEDSKQLRKHLDYNAAMTAVETGDYKTAYEKFTALGTFKDAAKQKDIIYYEALAFRTLFKIQSSLKDPSSLRVTKIAFYTTSDPGEIYALFSITATNSYGGSIGGFVYDLAAHEESSSKTGMISHSDYADPDTTSEALIVLILEAVKKETPLESSVDIARMNRLLAANASFKIDLPFQNGSIVEN